MKKQVLMIAVVCLMALPSLANDLAEQLCADEVFVSMVEETQLVVKHMQSLNASQREQYLRSEEFACFGENIVQSKKYLSETFNLFERADRELVIRQAIKRVAKLTDPATCELYYNYLFISCFNINPPDPFLQAECFAYAYQWYLQCLGTGGGVE
jgi:hypothetical protein